MSDYNQRRRRPDANHEISGGPTQAQLLWGSRDGCYSHGALLQTKSRSNPDMHLSQAWWAEVGVYPRGDDDLFEYSWELISHSAGTWMVVSIAMNDLYSLVGTCILDGLLTAIEGPRDAEEGRSDRRLEANRRDSCVSLL